MNIFMVTKPISPIWDEGSKNLAFSIAIKIRSHKFHLMTCKDTKLPKIENITYHYFYPNSNLNTPKINLFNKIRLFYKIFSKKDIDIYHFIFTHRFSSSLASKLFLKFSKRKSIQTISTPLTQSNLKRCLFADKIVVLSDWTKNKILNLGYKNVIKINPGVDFKRLSKEKTPTIREKLNIPQEGLVILFPNNYSSERGTRVFLKIIKKLMDDFAEVRIIFACRIRDKKDVKEKKFLMKAVKNMRLENRIIFLDRVPYMFELINSSDIVIFPTFSQSLKMEIPLVLLESLALEKPVVISDIPPLNELFSKNEAGIKIKLGDAKSLFESIVKLIKDKNMRSNMGKRGRRLIQEKFDIEKIAEEYKKVYEELKSK